MADGRISQLPVEIAVLADVSLQLRLSQLSVEVGVLSNVPLQLRLSQVAVEIMVLEAPTSTEQVQLFIMS